MAQGLRHFLRGNGFLVAAVALPIVVVGFFLISTAIPRWTVPPPAYDVLLRADTYDRTPARVIVDFVVRDGQVFATARAAGEHAYPARTVLWLFDHTTLRVREIPLEVPEIAPGDPPRTFAVAALERVRVQTQPTAPDGYELRSQSHGSPGLIGDLFGMRRYRGTVSLANNGRVIPIALPPPHEHETPSLVGWVVEGGGR
jgi:hypothetical protein